jgi:hypothetical protein
MAMIVWRQSTLWAHLPPFAHPLASIHHFGQQFDMMFFYIIRGLQESYRYS